MIALHKMNDIVSYIRLDMALSGNKFGKSWGKLKILGGDFPPRDV